jgi:bacterioferritin
MLRRRTQARRRGSLMKGHDKIIDILNDVLTAELTAINQYFIHAKMCQNWGFQRLHGKIRHESIDEMKHADEVISRILYLEGVPNLQRLGKLHVGQTVKEQFQVDLELEKVAIERLNAGVETARAVGDNGTRELLEKILVGEEEHADWLETQLSLIAQVGEQNYLSQHLRE